MAQREIPAVFMRGGSSKGVFFHARDLPDDPAGRDRVFLGVIGSPDPYGRQLNGMGGGVSSVSKAVMIGPPSRPDVDVDYTFAQVAVGEAVVDYSANCGNLSSAVGPFAVDEGLLPATGDARTVTFLNTNSNKLIRATVPLEDGRFRVAGDFAIPGVAGSGARIRLDFLDPGGTTTGALLPIGRPVDTLAVGGDVGDVEATLVDSSLPCVFVAAERFGLDGSETVAALEADSDLMARLDRVRRAAGVAMGLGADPAGVPQAAPKIGLVAKPRPYRTLAGEEVAADAASVAARILSMGQVHRVLPLTAAMCLAVACRIAGSVPHAIAGEVTGDLRLANPSGVLPVDARVTGDGNGWRADSVTTYRTARPLMKGAVFVPG